jgi:hypothetical protein
MKRMRVPTVRFGRDNRPIEPSEHKYWSVGAVAVMIVVIIWAAAAIFAVLALALTDSLARAILPRRVRERYWHPGARNPETCPSCGGALAVREIRRPSGLKHPKTGRPLGDLIIYEGHCSECPKAFRWVNLGKVAPVLNEIEA